MHEAQTAHVPSGDETLSPTKRVTIRLSEWACSRLMMQGAQSKPLRKLSDVCTDICEQEARDFEDEFQKTRKHA